MTKQIYFKSWDEVPILLTVDLVVVLFFRTRTKETVLKWTREGKLPASKDPGGDWIYYKEDIIEYLNRNKNTYCCSSQKGV